MTSEAMPENDIHNREFEEVNTFPEKVGGAGVPSDDSDVIFWDPDADTRSRASKLEEQRIVPEKKVSAAPIHDEEPQKKAVGKELPVQPRGGSSEFESLALEVDSMEPPSGGEDRLAHNEDDFLSVLDDDQLNMIDEVVQRSNATYNEITAASAASESDADEHISLIVEERLVESKPLWADDDDFWLNDAEGFDVPPHELIEYLRSGGAASTKTPAENSAAAEKKPAEETVPVDPDHPYILKAGEGEVLINVAALIDPAKAETVSAAEEKPSEEEKTVQPARVPTISEIEIPIIIVEPDYLSDDEETEAAPPAAAEGLRDGRTIEISSRPRLSETTEDGLSREKASPAKNRLPDDFTITHIDLSEAEKIAKEDIFLLNEDDLIEELEQIDLVPIEQKVPAEKTTLKEQEKAVPGSAAGGDFTYLIPEKSTLYGDVKAIVEKEIKTPTALIIEEDVEDIKTTLKSYSDVSASSEELPDITDRIVLLEDDADIDRFVAAIPEGKRHDMKKLLSYLDGLFEKLPEDVVKTFADSEYFDLYVKIMNDLGE